MNPVENLRSDAGHWTLAGIRFVLFLAAVYNLAWGIVFAVTPEWIDFGSDGTGYTYILIRCIAMLVGVYGIAYYFSSLDPEKYWPFILAGLIGKILGPAGALIFIAQEKLSFDFFIRVNIANDIIWIPAFIWILWRIRRDRNIRNAHSAGQSVFQRILGRDFDNLHPQLQRLHREQKEVHAAGIFKVEWGSSGIAKMIARTGGLPSPSNETEIGLTIKQEGEMETWERMIGGVKVRSTLKIVDGRLIESSRGLKMQMEIREENGGHRIIMKSGSVLGIPFPPFFTPAGFAKTFVSGDKIHAEVILKFYPVGMILKYTGWIQIRGYMMENTI